MAFQRDLSCACCWVQRSHSAAALTVRALLCFAEQKTAVAPR